MFFLFVFSESCINKSQIMQKFAQVLLFLEASLFIQECTEHIFTNFFYDNRSNSIDKLKQNEERKTRHSSAERSTFNHATR
jgi:hypothetical protein